MIIVIILPLPGELQRRIQQVQEEIRAALNSGHTETPYSLEELEIHGADGCDGIPGAYGVVPTSQEPSSLHFEDVETRFETRLMGSSMSPFTLTEDEAALLRMTRLINRRQM